jgi:hypothetical protein
MIFSWQHPFRFSPLHCSKRLQNEFSAFSSQNDFHPFFYDDIFSHNRSRLARLSNKINFIFLHAGRFSIQRSVIISKFETVKIQALNKMKKTAFRLSGFPATLGNRTD